MRIGYPCINRSIGCRSDSTFRLRSYSEKRLIETVGSNLDCLSRILSFNRDQDILFFRVSSDLVPFASHPVCRFGWQSFFEPRLKEIGRFVRESGMRITMHPDQFIMLNSPDGGVHYGSVRELEYHCQVLDLMGLDFSCKVQIHVGGVYRDKAASMERFVERFHALDPSIAERIVLENDDRLFGLDDCLSLHDRTGVPVVLDTLHHSLLSPDEPPATALRRASASWSEADGLPVVDFSLQDRGGRKGRHAETIDPAEFTNFLSETRGIDFDVMLEIKDKEKSGVEAVEIAREDPRFIGNINPSILEHRTTATERRKSTAE